LKPKNGILIRRCTRQRRSFGLDIK
jgi:hypothetical protein